MIRDRARSSQRLAMGAATRLFLALGRRTRTEDVTDACGTSPATRDLFLAVGTPPTA